VQELHAEGNLNLNSFLSSQAEEEEGDFFLPTPCHDAASSLTMKSLMQMRLVAPLLCHARALTQKPRQEPVTFLALWAWFACMASLCLAYFATCRRQSSLCFIC
jgi:hypothetical protein